MIHHQSSNNIYYMVPTRWPTLPIGNYDFVDRSGGNLRRTFKTLQNPEKGIGTYRAQNLKKLINKLEEKKLAKFDPKTGYPLKMTLPGNKYSRYII